MKLVHSLQSATRLAHRGSASLAPLVLVPTMGALHAGHAALIRRAVRLAGGNGSVWVSLFVNPTQFGPGEDFSRYPRTLRQDADLCESLGVSTIFAPSAEEMYAADHSVVVDEVLLSGGLCGASRPGHFRGVCTVVAKLFNLLAPATAVFGEKDYQQLAVIRRMVRDLNFPVKIVSVPTVREPDGLALSSRNKFLTPEQRAQATVLRRTLLEARAMLKSGKSPGAAKRWAEKHIASAPLARLDYLEIVDAKTLQSPGTGPRRILTAVFFGQTRLIDNIGV